MKRFLLCLMVGCCSLAIAWADDAVREAQARLKDGGFYFGETNGAYDSETAAAVSRFQIRRGLQITGKLDAETAKALGVTAAPAQTSPAPSDAETWRRLRQADEQFLSKVNSGEIPPPRAADADSNKRLLVLSRERLRDYVAAFVLAGLDSRVGAELEFFADKVSYFDDGIVGHKKIRRDLAAYNKRWPERRFWLDGEVTVEPQPDSRLRVTFPLRYELRNGNKHSAGKVLKVLMVEVSGEDLQIVSVNEKKA